MRDTHRCRATSGATDPVAAIDAMVTFRTKVRNASLSAMKSIKKVAKLRAIGDKALNVQSVGVGVGIGEGDEMARDISETQRLVAGILTACDEVREVEGPRLGVKIEDRGSLSSWRPVDQQPHTQAQVNKGSAPPP